MGIGRVGAVVALAIAVTGCSSSGKHAPPCSASTAKPADSVGISGGKINPNCVALPIGKGLSIVNVGTTAVGGSMKQPANGSIDVHLPTKNAVYPFVPKTAGTYVFTCNGCTESLQVFVH